MGMACLVGLLTAYVALNTILTELANNNQKLPAEPLMSYLTWGAYFAVVCLVCAFLAMKWKGLRFWETALGALLAAAVFGYLIIPHDISMVMTILGVAGIVGAWLGSLGRERTRSIHHQS